MKRHPDACSCGGLWVGGVCMECHTICQCALCSASWDDICMELVVACEELPLDEAPEPDSAYNRLRTVLLSAAATYRRARGKE